MRIPQAGQGRGGRQPLRGLLLPLRALSDVLFWVHMVQHELLMPVLPLFRVNNAADAIAAALRCEHGFHHTATMHSTNIDNMAAMARVCNCSIFVKNDASYAGLGLGGEGYTSFTIASPTGEGLTGPRSFSRWRRCVLVDNFRIT